jgi:hypothetical protein
LPPHLRNSLFHSFFFARGTEINTVMATGQLWSAHDWVDFYRIEARNALGSIPTNNDRREALRTRLRDVAEWEINRRVEQTKASKTYRGTVGGGELEE